jgi:dTDP-4-amino-4,6-dideoxygalactose transaminase
MQFIDLKAQYAALKHQIDAAIQAAVTEGQFIMGRQVEEFENEASEFLGVKYFMSCANGTDALQMMYMAYGIGAGDAVFCPDITFVATVEPAVMLGAVPVFCDVSPDSFNMCPESLERQIKAVIAEGKLKPKAIVPVDILGNPADYPELERIAKQYGMILIEDAAQSFGSELNGKKCGSFGDSAITSFFPAKPLGCYGDGGAVMTNDDGIAALCRSIRVHGKGRSKYENVRVGMNSRLDTIQAAVLSVKIKALRDYEMDARHHIAARYNEAFAGKVQVQKITQGGRSAYAQYVFLAQDTESRDAIAEHLKTKGIPTMIYYPLPQHELDVFSGVNSYGEGFEVSSDYCRRTLSLPMHPYLKPKEQDMIIEAVIESL